MTEIRRWADVPEEERVQNPAWRVQQQGNCAAAIRCFFDLRFWKPCRLWRARDSDFCYHHGGTKNLPAPKRRRLRVIPACEIARMDATEFAAWLIPHLVEDHESFLEQHYLSYRRRKRAEKQARG